MIAIVFVVVVLELPVVLAEFVVLLLVVVVIEIDGIFLALAI